MKSEGFVRYCTALMQVDSLDRFAKDKEDVDYQLLQT